MVKKTLTIKEKLKLDCSQEAEKISKIIRVQLSERLKRKGVVLGLSGGIDSSVTLALSLRAVGKERIAALFMPEKDSYEETRHFSYSVADFFSIELIHEDITNILKALGFYKKYTSAVQTIIPEYNNNWRSKIVSSNILDKKGLTYFSIIAQSPDGQEIKKRLNLQAYLGIIAATSLKQRTRKMLEYYHADHLHFAVAGTANRLEYDQGFFVKNGDGAADIKPIAHLYKTQVYQLAEYLGVPEDVISRPPTTDTYSLPQGQDEFYFSLPYSKMDICLFAKNNNIKPEVAGEEIGLTKEQVISVFEDIDRKRSTTKYLHLKPLLIENIGEIKD
jgi:NAD+ synthase